MSGQDCLPLTGANARADLDALHTEPRLRRRAVQVFESWLEKPALAFPEVFGEEAELDGAYRFFNNPRLEFEQLLQPHLQGTLRRAASDVVLSLEDTSAFTFGGPAKRQGLGRINKDNQGFLGHFSLLVSAEGERRPYGLAGAELWVRPNEKKARKKSRAAYQDRERESFRWERMVDEVEARVGKERVVIHVQDREGDIYSSVASMRSKGRRFVVRCLQNRRILENERGDEYVFEALEGLPVMGTTTVNVSARPGSKLPHQRKAHPPRTARQAVVSITATSVEICAPHGAPADWPRTAKLNLVHVFEGCPPQGEEPVEWILLTSEPVNTLEDVERVISFYSARWLIEELFKSVKTGCAYEKRQFETFHALKNVLAVCLPIAWEMLALRALERTAPETPASEVLEPTRLEVLRAMARRYPLPENPTVADALFAIAGMGGFLKRNGKPGWLTLRRGYVNLLTYEDAWQEAKKRCAIS